MIDSISKSYAVALIDSLKESFNNKNEEFLLDDGISELQKVEKIMDDELTYKFLVHPNIANEEKQELIKKSLKGFNQNIISFILVLIDNKRLNRLKDIIDSFLEYLDELKGIIRVEIITNTKLDKVVYDKIIKTLENNYQKKVIASTTISKEIIGGIIVKQNGYIIDDSLLNKLKAIKDVVLYA